MYKRQFYDRLGLGEEMYSILGVKLPYMIIPVRPGRNLAGIVEIATMKNRQMKFGYNPVSYTHLEVYKRQGQGI